MDIPWLAPHAKSKVESLGYPHGHAETEGNH